MGGLGLRLLLLWAVLIAAIWGLRMVDAGLEARGDERRETSGEIVPLVDPERTGVIDEALGLRAFVGAEDGELSQVAALTVERIDGRGGREPYRFARSRGVWRCLTHFGLVADEAQIYALINGVLEARGAVRAVDLDAGDSDLDAYGLGPDGSVRITLHGRDILKREDEDVLFAFEVGRPLARGGSFARVDDGSRVIELDRDLAAGLRFTSRPVTGLATPPLADLHVIPNAWPGFQSGIDRVFVDRADGTGFELRREVLDGPPDPMQPGGGAPSKWVIVDAETDEPEDAHPVLAMGFELFLARAEFAAPIDPRTVSESDLTRPDAILTIQPVEGEAVQVRFLREGLTGERVVIDGFSQTAVQVDRQIVDLLLPDIEQLVDPSRGNPWDPYLR